MTYKDIMIHVEDDGASTTAIDYACLLAEAFDAHLTGVYVIPVEPVLVSADAEAAVSVMASLREEQEKKMNAAKELFEERLSHRSILNTWRSVEGHTASLFVDSLRYADLGIVSQPAPGYSASGSFVNAVLLGAGCPIVVVAERLPKEPSIGKRMVIAWNESREASRAVAHALPMLKRAESVDVVTLHTSRLDQDNPAIALCEHLARHGINAEAHELVSRSVGSGAEEIMEFAKQRSCDMLVMGAWGHSRFREILLGGVTHDMLLESDIPVFLSH